MLENFKVSFLFIGAIIGAGFATGREIALYFAESNPLTIISTAIFIGVFCGFFMFYGKIENRLTSKFYIITMRFVNFSVLITVILTYIAMLAGAETLFMACFDVSYTGLITGLLCAVLSVFSMKSVKNINFFIVPLLIIMTICLFIKTKNTTFPTHFTPIKALNYTAMNLLLGGFLIKDQGKTMKKRNIFCTSVITSIIIGALLFFMYCVTLKFPQSEMPVFEFAKSVKLHYAAAAIIFFAIFSTMLSGAKLIADNVGILCGKIVKIQSESAIPKICGAVFIAGISVFCFHLNFKNFVDATYPPVGIFGIAYIVFCSISFAVDLITRSRKSSAKSVVNKTKKTRKRAFFIHNRI